MCELLWSDPQPQNGYSPSKRGVGIQFGPDVTDAFLRKNKLDYVIRSHEVKPEGYEIAHDGKCITVFSAPNYCDTIGNKGAFIRLKGDQMVPKFTTYEAVVSAYLHSFLITYILLLNLFCNSSHILTFAPWPTPILFFPCCASIELSELLVK